MAASRRALDWNQRRRSLRRSGGRTRWEGSRVIFSGRTMHGETPALGVALCVLLYAYACAHPSAASLPPDANVIQKENALPGVTGWLSGDDPGSPNVFEAYASAASAHAGETIHVMVSS